MKFSHNILQEYVTKKLPAPDKLAELLTLHSFEIKEVKKVGLDYIYDIDILPNRAHDAASHIGVARDAAALIGAKLKFKIAPLPKGKVPQLSIEVKNKNLCPRYSAVLIQNVNVKDSPPWLKTRLNALGVKSINNIVDAANYIMLVSGQPLHAFDYDKIAGHKIVVRTASNGENVETLDNKTYLLEDSMLVIADSQSPLAIAGIKGGRRAEVQAGTKTIVLESANFDALSIRQTSKALGLTTDASWRFEHEITASFTEPALAMVTALIKQLVNGRQTGRFIDTLTRAPFTRIIGIGICYTRDLLGADITQKDIKKILESLEFKVKVKNADMLTVTIPDFRLDIEREEDLIEEVGRIVGYEKIVPRLPSAALRAAAGNMNNYWRRRVRDGLAAYGFNEIYSPAFISEYMAQNWGFTESKLLELHNPLSRQLQFLAPSLLPNLAKASYDNLRFFDAVHIFEVAKTFRQSDDSSEDEHVGLAIATSENDPQNFFTLKNAVVQMLNSLGIADLWFDDVLSKNEEQSLSYLHPVRAAQIKVGETTLGAIGQLHPKIASVFGYNAAIFLCELSLMKIAQEAEGDQEYVVFSDYPKAVRDISIMVSRQTRIGDVTNVIYGAGGPVLRDVELFDYYEDSVSQKDEKSIAFHLIFQAADRTLQSAEVDKFMKNIIQDIEKTPHWKVKI